MERMMEKKIRTHEFDRVRAGQIKPALVYSRHTRVEDQHKDENEWMEKGRKEKYRKGKMSKIKISKTEIIQMSKAGSNENDSRSK